MAEVANIVDAQYVTYAKNDPLAPYTERVPDTHLVTFTLFEGGVQGNAMGWASTRFPAPSPDPQHGSTTPAGPQRWPL